MRTRLYFTSESHIHSAFNVLRWGHQYARAPGGQPCLSIFSEEARAMFDEWALGYLTQLLFRVLYRKGEDETRPSSYTVQILVSPGVSLSEMEASSPSKRGSVSAPQVHTEPPPLCAHYSRRTAYDLHRAHHLPKCSAWSVRSSRRGLLLTTYYSPPTTHDSPHPLPTTC